MRIRTHTNPFNYFARMTPISFEEKFENHSGTIDFEVGFGRGLFIRDYAQQCPDRNTVGIEVRKNVVINLQQKIDKLSIKNVLLLHGNAQICLEDIILDDSIDRCFVFHPDPWFKKSHHKRRVINPKFLATLHPKMKKTGKLYISTDVALLWEEMQQTLTESGLFTPCEDPEFWKTHYTTNWQKWSDYDRRNTYFGTFSPIYE